MISFTVFGTPVPQGSKRHVGGGRMVEMGKDLRPWRQDIALVASRAMEGGEAWLGPIELRLTFHIARPKGHFGTGRNAGTLKSSAPHFPATQPDVDKLSRAVLDALTGIVYRDDSQVVSLDALKRYATEAPGVTVEVMFHGIMGGRLK